MHAEPKDCQAVVWAILQSFVSDAGQTYCFQACTSDMCSLHPSSHGDFLLYGLTMLRRVALVVITASGVSPVAPTCLDALTKFLVHLQALQFPALPPKSLGAMLPPPAVAAAEAPSMLASATVIPQAGSHAPSSAAMAPAAVPVPIQGSSGSSPEGPAPDEPRLLRAVGPMAWHSSAPRDEGLPMMPIEAHHYFQKTPPSAPNHAVAQFPAVAPAPLAAGTLSAPAKAPLKPQAEAPKNAEGPSAHAMQMRGAVRMPSAPPADARHGASSAATSAGAPQPLMALPGGAAGAPASMPAVNAAGQIGNSTIAQPLQGRSLAPDISEGTLALHGNGTLVHSSSLGLPPKGLPPIEGPVLGLAPEGQPFEGSSVLTNGMQARSSGSSSSLERGS